MTNERMNVAPAKRQWLRVRKRRPAEPKKAFRVRADFRNVPRELILDGAVVAVTDEFGNFRGFQVPNLESGTIVIPDGAVAGYEPCEKIKSGWNLWHIEAADSLYREDEQGRFWPKPIVHRATLMRPGEVPELIHGAEVLMNDDGTMTLVPPPDEDGRPRPPQTGQPGRALWVRTGTYVDGTPKCHILALGTESVASYEVLGPGGDEPICGLNELPLEDF